MNTPKLISRQYKGFTIDPCPFSKTWSMRIPEVGPLFIGMSIAACQREADEVIRKGRSK